MEDAKNDEDEVGSELREGFQDDEGSVDGVNRDVSDELSNVGSDEDDGSARDDVSSVDCRGVLRSRGSSSVV